MPQIDCNILQKRNLNYIYLYSVPSLSKGNNSIKAKTTSSSLSSPLTSFASLHQLFNFSKIQLPHLWNEGVMLQQQFSNSTAQCFQDSVEAPKHDRNGSSPKREGWVLGSPPASTGAYNFVWIKEEPWY